MSSRTDIVSGSKDFLGSCPRPVDASAQPNTHQDYSYSSVCLPLAKHSGEGSSVSPSSNRGASIRRKVMLCLSIKKIAITKEISPWVPNLIVSVPLSILARVPAPLHCQAGPPAPLHCQAGPPAPLSNQHMTVASTSGSAPRIQETSSRSPTETTPLSLEGTGLLGAKRNSQHEISQEVVASQDGSRPQSLTVRPLQTSHIQQNSTVAPVGTSGTTEMTGEPPISQTNQNDSSLSVPNHSSLDEKSVGQEAASPHSSFRSKYTFHTAVANQGCARLLKCICNEVTKLPKFTKKRKESIPNKSNSSYRIPFIKPEPIYSMEDVPTLAHPYPSNMDYSTPALPSSSPPNHQRQGGPSVSPQNHQGHQLPSSPPPSHQGRQLPSSSPPSHQGHQLPSSPPPSHQGHQLPSSSPLSHQGRQLPSSSPPSHQGRQLPSSSPPSHQGCQLPSSPPPSHQGRQLPTSSPPSHQGRQLPSSSPRSHQGHQLPSSSPPSHQGRQLPLSPPPSHQGRQLPTSSPPSHQRHQLPSSSPSSHQGHQLPLSPPPSHQGRQLPSSSPPSHQEPLPNTSVAAGILTPTDSSQNQSSDDKVIEDLLSPYQKHTVKEPFPLSQNPLENFFMDIDIPVSSLSEMPEKKHLVEAGKDQESQQSCFLTPSTTNDHSHCNQVVPSEKSEADVDGALDMPLFPFLNKETRRTTASDIPSESGHQGKNESILENPPSQSSSYQQSQPPTGDPEETGTVPEQQINMSSPSLSKVLSSQGSTLLARNRTVVLPQKRQVHPSTDSTERIMTEEMPAKRAAHIKTEVTEERLEGGPNVAKEEPLKSKLGGQSFLLEASSGEGRLNERNNIPVGEQLKNTSVDRDIQAMGPTDLHASKPLVHCQGASTHITLQSLPTNIDLPSFSFNFETPTEPTLGNTAGHGPKELERNIHTNRGGKHDISSKEFCFKVDNLETEDVSMETGALSPEQDQLSFHASSDSEMEKQLAWMIRTENGEKMDQDQKDLPNSSPLDPATPSSAEAEVGHQATTTKQEEADFLEIHPEADLDDDSLLDGGMNKKDGKQKVPKSLAIQVLNSRIKSASLPVVMKKPCLSERPAKGIGGGASLNELMTQDWVKMVAKNPPPPPPPEPTVSYKNEEEINLDSDEELGSVSTINGPVTMTTFSNDNSNNSSEKREFYTTKNFFSWQGHCRFHVFGKCHLPTCKKIHAPIDSIPNTVKVHKLLIEKLSKLTTLKRTQITDEILDKLKKIDQDLVTKNVVDAWKKSKEMGTVMSISFFEDVLKFTSQLAIIDAELVSIAEESFYTIKQARESSPQDLDYMLVCYIKNGNLMRALEILEEAVVIRMPSKERFVSYITALASCKEPHRDTLIRKLQKMLLECLPKHISVCSILGTLLSLLLKNSAPFLKEIYEIVDACIQGGESMLHGLDYPVSLFELCLSQRWWDQLKVLLLQCNYLNAFSKDLIRGIFKGVIDHRAALPISRLLDNCSIKQLSKIDSGTWCALIELMCYNKYLKDVKKLQMVVAKLNIDLSPKTVWLIINFKMDSGLIDDATEDFASLKTVSPSEATPTAILKLTQNALHTKNFVHLHLIVSKLLENGAIPPMKHVPQLMHWFLDNSKLHDLARLLHLINRNSPKLWFEIPRPLLEVVNERLLNWNGDQAALEILKSFLYDGKVGESSAHDVTHSGNNERSKLSIIQDMLKLGEWDVVAILIHRQTESKDIDEILQYTFTQMIQNLEEVGDTLGKLIQGFCIENPDHGSLTPKAKEAVSRLGLSLILHCAHVSQWENGFQVLHLLHSHGIRYLQIDPVSPTLLQTFPTRYSRLLAAVLICVRSNPASAIEIFRGYNYMQPDSGKERIMAVSVIGELLDQLFSTSADVSHIREILDSYCDSLGDRAFEAYHSLFVLHLNHNNLQLAHEVCMLICEKWETVRKLKLVELLVKLHEAKLLEMKESLLCKAFERGILAKLSVSPEKNEMYVPDEMSEEEAAILLTDGLSDLCFYHINIKFVILRFSSAALIKSHLNFMINFQSPTLKLVTYSDKERPFAVISQESLTEWRRTNIPPALWGAKGFDQHKQQKGHQSCQQLGGTLPSQIHPVQMSMAHPEQHQQSTLSVASSPLTHSDHKVLSEPKPMRSTKGDVKAWKMNLRSSLIKIITAALQQCGQSKFETEDVRRNFIKVLCYKFSKEFEKGSKGPWILTASETQDVDGKTSAILSAFSTITTASLQNI